MGGGIDSGVGISSKPSLQQSSDLEKTQAELRQTFTAAEKFRRELEFLQKGGDPLDLKSGNAASISFQSTSLTDRHPEQLLTSEAKGSFAITASPHGDSVESSGRLGACEPNSADNLMLFDGDNSVNPHANTTTLFKNHSHLDVGHVIKESGDSPVLELPKKSYRRRIRSRPNRDGARSSSNDAIPSRGAAHFLPFRHASKPKSPNNANVGGPKSSVNHLESEIDDVAVGQSTLGPAHGPYSDAKQNTQENHHERPIKDLTDSERPPQTELSEKMPFSGPTNGLGNTEEMKTQRDDGPEIPAKVIDSESSCTQTSQRFDGYNGNGLPTGPKEQDLASKEVVDLVAEKDDKILNINKDKNHDVSAIKEEEGLKGSESSLQNELKNSISETERKPSIVLGTNQNDTSIQECTMSVRHCDDVAEQNACSENNLKLANKEREDLILEEARIIEAKRKRIAELSVRTLPLETRLKSQWDFVLEEMSWLANDFAQERLWKLTAAAQISRKVALSSRVRLQQQISLHKQKEVAHTLAEAVMRFWHTIQVKHEESDSNCLTKIGVQGYAMRFLEYNSSKFVYNSTQAPVTPDNTSDLGAIDLSWEDNLTEENLFYTVPPGAIEAYRRAIESHLLQFERTGNLMQEEVDTSGYDAIADNAFEEDEGETNAYYSIKNPKTPQKRRKNFKFYGPRPYETGGDVAFERTGGTHVTQVTQPSVFIGKRPATSLNVSIPTKRVRTASRQRIISPFNAGTSQVPNRTDASSGDTNSFQDEQSSLHGGSQIPNNMEAESAGDYEKQLQFDSMEVSNRPKKKKKKHPGSTFEQRWQLDSNFQNGQDHSRRRLDTHQFDSNGSSSMASQMSNMSSPNKIMKLLVRDRGRKAKALKTPVGQPGSGSPWSLFEDQALVVLVHDMGPNWELISDAINSTLQFKCIFRKSKECKERHKILMDRNTGDGADSAEDSGSSQPYPSTLPGIPEGSARQLFQRLQGPMEEDTLKSHFEKIIMIGRKQHYRRTQNDNQDPKQLQQPHSSHAFALSQVCPNNLNGGSVLTPLELSEPVSSSPDVLPVGFQGPGGLPVLNHGLLPGSGSGSGSTSSAPGSSNSVHGTNLPSASGPLNPAVREGRYGIPRAGSISVDDQQKMQQYNQMLSRNTNQPSLPPGSHSVTDRGVRMLPAGSGMGVMCGMGRGIKMVRPGGGFQGIPSSSMLTSGQTTPSPGQGNSMLRSHMIRPNQNTDHQKMVATDIQMQQVAPPGGSGGGGGVSPFTNQIPQPPPLHHQQQPPPQSPRVLTNPHHPHHFQGPTNPQHPAYGRFAKERQLQQQRLRQQQFSTSNPMIPHVQPQDSQSPQNSARSSSPPVSISPMPQLPQKHPVPGPGLVRNPSGGQVAKQQRHHQSPPFPQPNKLMKSGRGAMIHQNLPNDSSLVNGFSGGQSSADKGEQQVMPPRMIHGNLYSGKQSSLTQPHQQTATYSGQGQSQSQTQAASSKSNQKLGNQKQATTPQKLLLNRKMNLSDQPTTKIQAESPMSLNTSQTSTAVTMPPHSSTETKVPVVSSPCQKTSEKTFHDSSGGASDNAATQLGKNMVRLSPPQTGAESEHSGTAAKQSSSDMLSNPVRHDVGVQWQQPPPHQQPPS